MTRSPTSSSHRASCSAITSRGWSRRNGLTSSKPARADERARAAVPLLLRCRRSDAARAELGGVLATICPADKKIIHGMTEAVFAPCSI